MKNKTIQFGLVAGLIAAGMLINNIARAQPKVSPANRETVRIMKTIKIPPPYTPVYLPMIWQQYVPSTDTTPDCSPKVGPVQPFSIPASAAVTPSALPVTTTNTARVSVTNIPVIDKAAKTPSFTATPDKAPEVSKPVEKTPANEKIKSEK